MTGFEGGIEATMIGAGEPDEVRMAVIHGDAVEMVALERMTELISVLRAIPREGDRDMNKDIPEGLAQFEVALLTVRVVASTGSCVGEGILWNQLPLVQACLLVAGIDVCEGTPVSGDVQWVVGCSVERNKSYLGAIRKPELARIWL